MPRGTIRKVLRAPKRPLGWVGPSAPLSQRKQVYLPNATIALIRTPFLPPRYASFYVPLNFNKLDLRDYLQRLYGVGVLRIRSYVEQQKVTRMRRDGKGYGPLRRPRSKKRMTVEMKQPFVWPDVPEDMSPWEKDQFYKAAKYQDQIQKAQRPEAGMEPNKEEREAFEEEAKKLLDGSKPWRPTWQALGLNYDRPIVGGAKGISPGSSRS
ncbi:mitochondrial 54S ribosomal protein uL23m [Aspergillus lucknowensis]|uniref:Large ribosomal subunit protein uL23m n=1 Tax=Aspergillus lucknowensis TaxID=176173 RepID=A0ABR4LKN0_9EURO